MELIGLRKYDSVNIAPSLKSLAPEEITYYLTTYQNAKDADLPHRIRGIQNMKMTLGLFYDAWPEDLASALLKDGRDPKTYNFAQKFVAAIVGNYIANSFDPKLIDREDDNKDTTSTLDKLNRIYYSDKDLMKYKQSEHQCIWNGVVYRGVEEIQIVRWPDEPRGRIGFASLRPDQVIFDLTNYTDNISRNSKRAWKEFYLTADEMMLYYPWAESRIINAKAAKAQLQSESDMVKRSGQSFDTINQDMNIGGPENRRAHQLLVVECYHIEYEKTSVVIDGNTGYVFSPTGKQVGSEEDFLMLSIEAATKGLTLNPENLHIRENKLPVLYLTTICPELGIVLDNRKDERQLKGHLPFYVWSYVQKSGVTCGVVDFIYPAVQDFNNREAAKSKIITQTQIADKVIIHPLATGDSIDRQRDVVANFNDPRSPIILDRDAPPGMQLISKIPGSNISNAILQDESFKIQLLNDLANVPPAFFGQTGNSAESGVAFGRKVIEGNITHRPQVEALVCHNHDKAEDWTTLAIQLYGGRNEAEKIANYNRSFTTSDTGKISVNNLTGYDNNGEPIVIDDISNLKRVDVIITQSKENDFQRQAKMEMDSNVLRSVQPTATNGIIFAAFLSDFIKSQQFEDDASRSRATEAAELYYNIEKANAEKMLASLQAPPQPQMMGAPGQPEGAPVMAGPEGPGAAPEQPPIAAPEPVPGREGMTTELGERVSTPGSQPA